MSDETPAWWPLQWYDDGDGDLGCYPFGRRPEGWGCSLRYPFVRQWRADHGPYELFSVYTGANGTFRTDDPLEVLIYLCGLTATTD